MKPLCMFEKIFVSQSSCNIAIIPSIGRRRNYHLVYNKVRKRGKHKLLIPSPFSLPPNTNSCPD